MQTDVILQKIKSLLNTDEEIAVDQPLITSGRLSSLKVIELAVWLEKTYHADFSQSAFNIYDFNTVQAISELVEEKLKQKN